MGIPLPPRWTRSRSATARTIPALASMPILTASAPMSSRTASICAATISAGTSWTARTSRVFWAVSAVIALMP